MLSYEEDKTSRLLLEFAKVLLMLTFLFWPFLAKAEQPLCMPVEYETSPFFVHFSGPNKPALVVIHGGFSSTKESALFCSRFSKVLGDDYSVVSVDYRFSSLGGGELVDVLRGIRLAKERWKVKSENLHLLGVSHGGFLALLAASKEEVGSVVDAYGPTNWLIQWQYVKTHRPDILKKWGIYLAISKNACKDEGLDFKQCLIDRSVVSPKHLKGLRDPVLIIHGDKDNLVPLKESILLAEELKKSGIKVSLKVLPEQKHGFPLWEGEPLKIIRDFLKRAKDN